MIGNLGLGFLKVISLCFLGSQNNLKKLFWIENSSYHNNKLIITSTSSINKYRS